MMFEYLNTPPDAAPPEYNCRVCGTPLYCAGLCWQCRREELFVDEIKELSRQDPRESYDYCCSGCGADNPAECTCEKPDNPIGEE